MAKLNKRDILELSPEELDQKIEDQVKLYTDKQFTHAISPLENPLELKVIRKNIARLNTELRRREIKA